ncbi:hypothetical protein [Halorubrum laminariae]|uniref:Uncharacterized protein n=1 Tax=Halorubrum laminariae TaxID=1433523 RepID=A0ABD6BZU2_9EURY|nr:hypothetical protein [Halorubrum laminariae]
MSDTTTLKQTEQTGPPPTHLPDPPKITGYQSSGGELGSPSTITLTVEFYTPGIAEPYETDVLFSIINGTAEFRRVEAQLGLSKSLIAVEAASKEVSKHPAVTAIEGVDAIVESQRQWIGRCKQFNETGWVEMPEKPDSTIASCVEAYENKDGEQYIIWTTSEDDDNHPDILVEHHHGDDDETVDTTPCDTLNEAREKVARETTGVTEE